jgi:hypothetical protein
MAMMNFDQGFYLQLVNCRKVVQRNFSPGFIPLMNELGLLWQSDTITQLMNILLVI